MNLQIPTNTPQFLAAAILGLTLAASPVTAGISGPYASDANTLHLWHLDEADPGPAADSGNGTTFGLTPTGGTLLGATSFAGFGSAGDASAATVAGLRGSSIPISGVTGAGERSRSRR